MIARLKVIAGIRLMSLLEVKNLRIEYPSRFGTHAAVKNLSFNINRGEIVGVVGESDAGKSTVGNAIIDLLSPPGIIAGGEVFLDGDLILDKNIQTPIFEQFY